MLSSILSNNRDVVALVPVQQMASSYSCDLTKQVITNVTNAGYTVISGLLYTTGNEGFLYTHANALKAGRLVVQ